MSRPWPRWAGALGGFLFLALFVTVPDIRRIGWQPSMMIVGGIAGAVGAVVGWGLVVIRNRLMVQR
jgi:Cu/Ag efflux pump CusA